LTVVDDGRGFEASERRDGNGLVSMQRRAQSVGGTLSVISQPGSGTTVTLTVPIAHARRTAFGHAVRATHRGR
jgi:signal transduction histidine kinase